MDSFARSPHYFIAIITKNSDHGHIGNMNVYVDERNEIADIGILLGDKSIWGQGYGVEAWSAACRFLLLSLNLRKVTAGTSALNAGMIGIMRRANMVDDGRKTRQLLIEGQETDVVYTALFREALIKT
jgi:ribosomal-protein-alanine N-acetyltransferase